MYVRATSTHKVEKIAAKFGVESLFRDQISRLCAVIDGQVDAFLSKDWSALRFSYLFLDATYAKCQDAGHMRFEAFIIAIGIGDDGRKHFVGFSCANAESYLSWRGFLQDLWERGVKNVRLITSRAHTGLTEAISEVFPLQPGRCITHLKRDVLKKVEKRSAKQHALAVMAPIFKESDPALVRALTTKL